MLGVYDTVIAPHCHPLQLCTLIDLNRLSESVSIPLAAVGAAGKLFHRSPSLYDGELLLTRHITFGVVSGTTMQYFTGT
jgi:hypothetical protein